MATTTATQIQQLYVGLLGRAADQGGLNWWADQVTTGGKTLEDVRASFVTSTEYTTTYGAAATRADLVTSIYQNLFERTPSADEVKYWAETDTRPADQLVAAFIEFAGAADQAVINNKTFVAQTYTDTVGANYNGAAGAAVIVGVNGTSASVSTALANITNGTLTGLVPGVSLINAIAAANTAVTDFAKATAITNPTFDGAANSDTFNGANVKDGSVNSFEAADALSAANTARGLITGTTAEGTAALITANTTLATAKALAGANGNATAASAFDAAVLAQKALIGTATITQAKTAAVAAENAALAGADVALTANASVTTAGTVNYASLVAKYNAALGTNGTALTTVTLTKTALQGFLDTTPTAGVGDAGATPPYTADQNLTALLAAKAALTAELAKLPTYGQSTVDAAAKVAALNASDLAVGTATTPGSAAASSVTDYAKAALTQAAAADNVAKITVADAAVAAAKVVVDKYIALDSSITIAKAALTTFANANTDKVTIADASLKANGGILATSAKSDVFYFASKLDAAKDLSIGTSTSTFGAGDSIVLGTGYTFNAGALSTGNANALEVFLIKGATGTQVVIETEAYGNSNTTVGTDGTVLASPNATVINLVGVTADHLSFNNGVVSYV